MDAALEKTYRLSEVWFPCRARSAGRCFGLVFEGIAGAKGLKRDFAFGCHSHPRFMSESRPWNERVR
jgi:hypothetical protein